MLRPLFLLLAALTLWAASREPVELPILLTKDGTVVCKPNARGDRIPDFSMVGYRGGTVPLPGTPGGVVVEAKAVLEPQPGDQTARVQAAIDSVAREPRGKDGFRGAVLLRAGIWEIASGLRIAESGVVLRGEGSDGAKATILRATGTKEYDLISLRGHSGPRRDTGRRQRIVDASVPVGATAFRIADPSKLAVGNTIMVERPSTTEWIKALGMDDPKTDWGAGYADVAWMREITAIDGDRITINAPVTTAIDGTWGGGTICPFDDGGLIEDVGIESLRCVSVYANDTDEAHAWRAISMIDVKHSYVRDVVSQYFAYGLVEIWNWCHSITIASSQCLDAKSVITGGRRYSFAVSGQLCLVRDCYARGGRHDFVNNNNNIAGPNVFVDCQAEKAISESGPHRHWTSGVLYDNVTTDDRISFYKRHDLKSVVGTGKKGHGWASANCVAWNCNVAKLLLVENPPTAQNWAIGCRVGSQGGDGIFVLTNKAIPVRSLYYAQLATRMRGLGLKPMAGLPAIPLPPTTAKAVRKR